EGDRRAFDADTACGASEIGRISSNTAALTSRIVVVDASAFGIQVSVPLHLGSDQTDCAAGTAGTLATDIRAGDATTVTTTCIDASGDAQGAGCGHKNGAAAAAAARARIVGAATPAATARTTHMRPQEIDAGCPRVSLRLSLHNYS